MATQEPMHKHARLMDQVYDHVVPEFSHDHPKGAEPHNHFVTDETVPPEARRYWEEHWDIEP